MRLITISSTLAVLLLTGAASAAGTGKEPGKGAAAPATGGTAPSGGTETSSEGRDAANIGTGVTPKPWEVGASYEFHHLFVQNDLEGAGSQKNLSYIGLYARWDITENNRLTLRGGIYQRYVADEGESGFRADDLSLAYTRRIPLPAETTMRVSFSLSAPTSFASQKASLITAPRLSVAADHKFFNHLTIDARIGAGYYWCRYAEPSGGANPNARASLSGTVGVDFSMPFHEPLSIGVSGYTGYTWFYNVANSSTMGSSTTDTGGTASTNGAIMPPSQPVQQSYGGEIYARYAFPALKGLRSDLTVAVAQGDPTLGYNSLIHDGAQHVYLFWRQTSEVYAVLAARY